MPLFTCTSVETTTFIEIPLDAAFQIEAASKAFNFKAQVSSSISGRAITGARDAGKRRDANNEAKVIAADQ